MIHITRLRHAVFETGIEELVNLKSSEVLSAAISQEIFFLTDTS